MRENTLKLLMQETAKGDENAFRSLAHHLGNDMHKRAMQLLVHRKEQADDAVQNALIKIWKNAPRWQDKGSVQGYAMRIIYNECMNVYRSQKEFIMLDDQFAVSDPKERKIMRDEEKRILLKAVQALNESQRVAIILYYFEEFSVKQVSEIMEKTEKAVESLIVRARIKLRKVLPKDFYQERIYHA